MININKISKNQLKLLKNIFSEIEMDPFTDEDKRRIPEIGRKIYEKDNPTMGGYTSMFPNLMDTQAMELSTILKEDNKTIGYLLIKPISNFNSFFPAHGGMVQRSMSNEEYNAFMRSCNSGKAAIVLDFGVIDDYRNKVFFFKRLLNITNEKLANHGIEYIISSFRNKSAFKMLNWIGKRGIPLGQIKMKEKDPFTMGSEDESTFTIIKLPSTTSA